MATARLIGWILTAVALCLIVAVTSIAYIETLYMKAQLKQEIRELRKLKQELRK